WKGEEREAGVYGNPCTAGRFRGAQAPSPRIRFDSACTRSLEANHPIAKGHGVDCHRAVIAVTARDIAAAICGRTERGRVVRNTSNCPTRTGFPTMSNAGLCRMVRCKPWHRDVQRYFLRHNQTKLFRSRSVASSLISFALPLKYLGATI